MPVCADQMNHLFMGLSSGPQPQKRADRQQVVDQIVNDLVAIYGERVLSIGIYGSMARQTDGPYSDIELSCVIEGTEVDITYEWIYEANKAEVAIQTPDVIRCDVLDMDEEVWPLWKRSYLDMICLYGDPSVFDEMRRMIMSPPQKEFDHLVGELVVELYERIGKLRNARRTGSHQPSAIMACEFLTKSALMLGIANKYGFTSESLMFEESLRFDPLPDGYRELHGLVEAGTLSDLDVVADHLERLWRGVVDWVDAMEIRLDQRTGWPLTRPESG